MPKLHKKQKRILIRAALAIVAAIVVVAFITIPRYAVLDAKGTIAEEQRSLLIIAVFLSLFVLIPVFILTFYIVWKFREGKQSTYTPEWEGSWKLETLWWGIPGVIILILSVITWQSSHALDPFKPIESDKRAVTIQVIALPWKWLFIYPEQNIASINYVQFPVDTPVHFQLTSDAPMNSFWIPQLGGQIYAMAGMSTSLHLQANELGRFDGSSANISGRGFAGMRFTAQATKQEEFNLWAKITGMTQTPLSHDGYQQLARSSENEPVRTFKLQDPQLYNKVIDSYMGHHGSNSTQPRDKDTSHHETD